MARPEPCPSCGGPLSLEGRFCKGCGWDADLAESEDSYLDGVDLPQGYAGDEEDGGGYERTVDGEGLRPSSRGPAVLLVILAVVALALLGAWLNAR